METNLLLVGLAVLGFGLLAGRLASSPVTMPMVFATAGLILGPHALGVLEVGVGNSFVSGLAEATLVVVLFSDASRMDLRTVLREHSLALRLLLLGLPLAIVVGVGAGLLLLPALSLAAVALLAATLAPTDAALGQSFVSNDAVPMRIRQTLNVESGLNDGLAVPFITILLDIAMGQTDSPLRYAGLLASLVGIGVAAGAAAGWAGGRLLSWSAGRQWSTASTQRLATIAVAAIAYSAAELAGGNGFVAAFTAGLVIGTTARELLPATAEFAEADGQLLTLVTFLLFGSVLVADALSELTWQVAVYALVSLLLVRPIAVALSLLGSGVSVRTVGFLGWAGPRGLASIVYAVLVAEASGVPGAETVFVVAAWTILASIFLHGASSAALSRAYGRSMQSAGASAGPEHRPVSHLPLGLPQRARQH